jgi:outer membrane protein assembly factor BamD|tara:strand:+ start:1721 stop:2557 length:837 start_codon:yes stop_codon:yes gene_type:complete
MKFIFTLILFSIFFLNSCGNKKEEKIILDSKDLESQMIEAYNKGLKSLEEGDVLFAAKNFNIVENIYPQSIWAPRSVLMAAYSFYSQDYYGDAISELKRFIKIYPENENTSYAYFLLATCYYELIVDEKKDLSSIIKSKEYYDLIIQRYPNTDFASDAKFKLLLIDSILASKEIYLGKYYLEKKKWIPAMNRFKNVINDFEETDYVEEAIHRLVEINYILGLEDEAKKYAILLGYNYQSSEWYKESYRVFNKKYENPRDKIKKDKRNKIITKFKELFK